MWVFSIIQNASDPREPKITNLTVEVNHSKIDKTEQKVKQQSPNVHPRASELTSRCQFERSWFSALWALHEQISGGWRHLSDLSPEDKLQLLCCAPPLCCPSKGKAGTTHSHLHSQPGAGKCYNAFAKWMCLPFLGLQSQSSIRKQLHIQKQVGWECLQPEQKKRRIRHPGVTAIQLLPGDAIQWWIGY